MCIDWIAYFDPCMLPLLICITAEVQLSLRPLSRVFHTARSVVQRRPHDLSAGDKFYPAQRKHWGWSRVPKPLIPAGRSGCWRSFIIKPTQLEKPVCNQSGAQMMIYPPLIEDRCVLLEPILILSFCQDSPAAGINWLLFWRGVSWFPGHFLQ